MNTNPLVSIIMPVYNCQKFIETSIQSILNQSYENFEFIIIDDGSTDNSLDIINSFHDKRIKFYRQDNRGVAITLNKGISLSKGNIIARQDADDISHPNRLNVQIQFLKNNPQVGLLGTFSNLIDEYGNIIRKLTFPSNNNNLQKEILYLNPFIHGSIVMRRKVLEKVGLYREQFLLAQSYDLWLRISEVSEIANIPEILYSYRVWNDCVSNKKAALFDLFSNIALELFKQRRKSGSDILMAGNNYRFYDLYGRKIVETLEQEKKFRWLR